MSQRATGLPLRAPLVALLVLVVVLAGGCSGDGDDDGASIASDRASGVTSTTGSTGVTDTTTPSSSTSVAGTETTTSPSASQLVAQSTGQVEVWDGPDEDDATSRMLSASAEHSGILTFMVLERTEDDWLRVQLPGPPVGDEGYIQVDDVSLNRHRYRIELSRSEHMLRVFAGEVEALSSAVALGPDAPPAGTRTFIRELVIPPQGSPYRGNVYGLAGWASTVDQYRQGRGVVAIHAADAATLGTNVSAGAIGADERVLARLIENIGLPLGTPVIVT